MPSSLLVTKRSQKSRNLVGGDLFQKFKRPRRPTTASSTDRRHRPPNYTKPPSEPNHNYGTTPLPNCLCIRDTRPQLNYPPRTATQVSPMFA